MGRAPPIQEQEMKTYEWLAQKVAAIHNCRATGLDEWRERHTEALEAFMRSSAPSGAGFDNGTRLNLERSNARRLEFTTAFHHMDEHGSYDGWTEHTVTVRPNLALGFELTVGGKDRNGIKDYIADVFHEWLSSPADN